MITVIQERLRQMLADCTSVRQFLGVHSRSEVLARIHHDGLSFPSGNSEVHDRDELADLRPYILLFTEPEDDGFVLQAVSVSADGFDFAAAGQLLIQLARDVPDSQVSDPAAADRAMKEHASRVIEDLAALAGRGDQVAITRIGAAGPFRTQEDDAVAGGELQVMEISIEHDQTGGQ